MVAAPNTKRAVNALAFVDNSHAAFGAKVHVLTLHADAVSSALEIQHVSRRRVEYAVGLSQI